MRHNLVQILDTKGRTFHIEVWTPSTATKLYHLHGLFVGGRGHRSGEWAVIDKGFLRVTEGFALNKADSGGVKGKGDLYLGSIQSQFVDPMPHGIVLYNYEDSFGAHDIGTGHIKTHWALGIEPGMIRWIRPSESEVVTSYVRRASR